MKKTKAKDQAELLRRARKVLGLTNGELAAQLGKSEATLLSWIAPATAAKRRNMPAGSRMLLKRILKEHRAKK